MKQVTCHCDAYDFPHRMGGGCCPYHPDPKKCDMCYDGHCDYHMFDDGYDPREEALTASERNEGRPGW